MASAGVGGRIALTDRNATYRAAMASCLRLSGYTVYEFRDGTASTIKEMTRLEADVALFGLEPDQSPVDVLEATRAWLPSTPVILVSEHNDAGAEERALAAGAADYFDRSRSPSIVAERVRLLTSGARAAVVEAPDHGTIEDEIRQDGLLTLRLGSHRVEWDGREVPLTVTEFRIIRLLVDAGEHGADYRAIYDEVHGTGFSAGDGPDGYRTNVRSLIRRIRAKFRRHQPDLHVIQNLPGVGYRWSATVGVVPAKPTIGRATHTQNGTTPIVHQFGVPK